MSFSMMAFLAMATQPDAAAAMPQRVFFGTRVDCTASTVRSRGEGRTEPAGDGQYTFLFAGRASAAAGAAIPYLHTTDDGRTFLLQARVHDFSAQGERATLRLTTDQAELFELTGLHRAGQPTNVQLSGRSILTDGAGELVLSGTCQARFADQAGGAADPNSASNR